MKNTPSSRLKWLPNLITSMRLILGILAFFAALQMNWATALWLLLAALATDFLDGFAARKFNASSTFGAEFDAISDSVLVFLGILSLGITGSISWWTVAIIFTVALAISSDRFFDQPVWRWRAMLAVASLFAAWIGIVWTYASLAYGWSWAYILMTLAVLVICALFKRDRISTWLKPPCNS